MTMVELPKLYSDFYWRQGNLYVVKNLVVGFLFEEPIKNWILHPDLVVMFLGFRTVMHYNSRTEPLMDHIELFFLDENKIVIAAFPSWEQAGYSFAFKNLKTGQLIDWEQYSGYGSVFPERKQH